MGTQQAVLCTMRARHVLVAVAVMAALVSCSSSDRSGTPSPSTSTNHDPTTSATGSHSPTSSGSTSASTDSASPPTTLSGSPIKRVRLDQVALGRVPFRGGGGPDWMAAGFGSLWVRRDNGVVTRLAPDGSVQAKIDAGIWQPPVCQGLGISDKAVWACATSGKLMRIDPRTNRVTAIVDIPKVNEQGRLLAYGHRIWILTGDGDRLVGLSESTNRPGRPINLDTYCTDLADRVHGADLWVACPYDGVVLRVNLDAGKVTGRVNGLPHAGAVAAGRDVWVCTDDGIARVDASSLSIKAVQPATGGFYCSLRLTGDTLWVRTPSSFLTAIDTSSGQVAEVITAPGPTSGGDVIKFGDALWVSAYDRELVYQLKAAQR